MSSPRTFTIASRASILAQVQTNHVLSVLQSAFPTYTFATSFMSTAGDKNQSQALYLLGGKSLWTGELEAALRENVVDMLVHCLKDVPTVLPEGFEIGGILEREDPVDCLVVKLGESWATLADLPAGSVVGTSSVRRVAQLKRTYSSLVFMDIRGNLNTRLAKLDAPSGPYAALILAKAGLVRLGFSSRITADIPPPTLFHAVSQGALAVEIRSDDAASKEFCAALTHRPTQWTCLAERAYLRVLEGGCSVPVGVASSLQTTDEGEVLTLTGCVTAIGGEKHIEHTLKEKVTSKEDSEGVGERLAKVLIRTGAKEILDEINEDRDRRVKEATV